MTQYYYTDGRERYGPFTLEQMRDRNITSETLVWKEGMADWAPAKQLTELETLFTTFSSEAVPDLPPFVSPVSTVIPPKNWLVESILVTIMCCLPLGIVGIVHATKVEDLWNAGRREEALRASSEAGKWVKIAFFAGLITWAIFFLFFMLGFFASVGSNMSN